MKLKKELGKLPFQKATLEKADWRREKARLNSILTNLQKEIKGKNRVPLLIFGSGAKENTLTLRI